MNDVASSLQTFARLVEQDMTRYLPGTDIYPQALHEAMRYSVFAGGKRLRPGLLLLTTEACQGSVDEALPAASAIEFVHTYSLIHDDLPAMDNDDYRRGKLTNHRVFGEANAILAGDALLTLAFEVVTTGTLDDRNKVRLVSELASASGVSGMVGGQAADILQEGSEVTPDIVHYIHRHKTGALVRAAVRMGAIAAKAPEELLQAVTAYAEAIGLAFQITDDILDVVGDSATLGKDTGADAALQKATWPAVYGLKESRNMVQKLTEKAIAAISLPSDSFDPTHLFDLALWLSTRDH